MLLDVEHVLLLGSNAYSMQKEFEHKYIEDIFGLLV